MDNIEVLPNNICMCVNLKNLRNQLDLLKFPITSALEATYSTRAYT